MLAGKQFAEKGEAPDKDLKRGSSFGIDFGVTLVWRSAMRT